MGQAPLISLIFAALIATPLWAAEPGLIQPASDSDLSEFIWKKRPVVVFADSADDPAFIEQMALLRADPKRLLGRDVVVLTDTDPASLAPARKKLRPRGFMLAIFNKEGRVQLRKPFPWDVREISRSIDKQPLRKREIQAAKRAGR